MRIAILGGTGNLGKGLSLRLAIAGYDVVVGSRDSIKAEKKAEEYSQICGIQIEGMSNESALRVCDVAILTIPWNGVVDFVKTWKKFFSEKIVVSPIVPMERRNGEFVYVQPENGLSMAEIIASVLDNAKVVSAYQIIPARRFANLDDDFEFDVIVCGDDEESKRFVIKMTNDMKGLRGLDGGGLKNSRMVERLTPFLINVSLKNKLGEIGLKLV